MQEVLCNLYDNGSLGCYLGGTKTLPNVRELIIRKKSRNFASIDVQDTSRINYNANNKIRT